MSATECIVMVDEKRGESARKQSRLAPKDDQASSTASSRSGGNVTIPSVLPRLRLPPRSRTGCWTCRTRKVKCDEGKPICGQCSRLNHTCDYVPRLAFRNDTPRVMERMQDVTVIGSGVWDRVTSPAPSSSGSIIDDLGPFADLLTDEDRERKAEASPAGTFQVIVNPDSFQHLLEYGGEDTEGKRTTATAATGTAGTGTAAFRRGSIAASLASSIGRDSMIEAVAIPGDPNTVILPRFEDLSRRSTRELRLPVSPTAAARVIIKEEEFESTLSSHSPELNTLRHFRDVVWKQLVPPEHGNDSSIVLLDEVAAHFQPLIKAMIAVGSLAMFQHDGKEKLDSLQCYSQTLPELQSSLRSEEDMASDGAFLTHFLMLLYEIATADAEHPNIWVHHISTLLKITLLRQRIFGMERFPYIIWWICGIDLDALLSGMGPGEYVEYMMRNDLVPPPSYHLYPLGDDGSSVVYPEERESLPMALQLDYEVTLQAIRLGLLANDFTNDTSYQTADQQQMSMISKIRQSRVSEIQEGLRQLWTAPHVQRLGRLQLPHRAQRVFHHAWTLYRACIIYSHTSMWVGQRLETSPDYDNEIATAAQQIIQVAQTIVANSDNSRFLVFPLFIAGFASDNGNYKTLALDLIEQLEENSIGHNAKATRACLQVIYEQQRERFKYTGHSLDIDWLQVMRDRRLSLVNFGF